MTLDELQLHPAYLSLTSGERAAVDARLEGRHLDETVAAATGDVEDLEASDLRFWLDSTRRRPWSGITLARQPERVLSLIEGLVDAAPALAARADRPARLESARSFARAAFAADTSRRKVGFVRDEHLDALLHRMRELEGLEPGWSEDNLLATLVAAELKAIAGAMRAHLRDSVGAAAFHKRVRARLETDGFNHERRANFVLHGTPDHEGHFDGREWKNWADDYRMAPKRFVLPRTEEELCAAVAQGSEVRVVGGGHSFNAGPLSPDTMISLDAYDRVLEIDPAARTARVQAGIRLRDLNKALDAAGLGLPVLGSTDPQSIGGLIATDLHGTGREHGFLSTSVRAMRVIAADGTARTVRAGDPLFHAVFGGVGACGVVAEVEFELVDAFRLEKVAELVDQSDTEDRIEEILAANDYVSFYCIGGAARGVSMQIHRWNRTTAPLTEDWERKKRRSELRDFAISAFTPGLAKFAADLDAGAAASQAIAPSTSLVLPASRAFGRKLYYRHDELESGVPMDRWRDYLAEVLDLHRELDLFSVVEVRFTPDVSQALIGPGVGRRTCYVGLATPMELERGEAYAGVEDILRKHDGRPHLGKQTFVTAADMLQAYGDRFVQFQAARVAQDPGGKFLNEFTRRLFGSV